MVVGTVALIVKMLNLIMFILMSKKMVGLIYELILIIIFLLVRLRNKFGTEMLTSTAIINAVSGMLKFECLWEGTYVGFLNFLESAAPASATP